MNSDVLIVNIIGALIIGGLFWWYFGGEFHGLFKEETQEITVLVKNGYYRPDLIEVNSGKQVKLNFIREDLAPCASVVTFPHFNLSYQLPVGQMVEITLPPLKSGDYVFTCPMGSYKGKIVVH